MNLQNLIAFFENKTAIEIGGPSSWMNYLYAHLKSIVYFNSKDGMQAYSESYNQSNSVNIHFGDIVNADEIAAFKTILICVFHLMYWSISLIQLKLCTTAGPY